MARETTGERLARLETKVEYIVEQVEESNKKIDDFIGSANDKYASKAELEVLKAKTDSINLTLAKYGGVVLAIIFVFEILIKVYL